MSAAPACEAPRRRAGSGGPSLARARRQRLAGRGGRGARRRTPADVQFRISEMKLVKPRAAAMVKGGQGAKAKAATRVNRERPMGAACKAHTILIAV